MVEVLRFMFESPLNYCGTLFAVFLVISVIKNRRKQSVRKEKDA
jgi:hypothetical protein